MQEKESEVRRRRLWEQSAGNGAEDLDKKENSRGSFTTRLILSTFLFLVFLYVSQNSVELQGISSHEIIEKIQENHDIFLID